MTQGASPIGLAATALARQDGVGGDTAGRGSAKVREAARQFEQIMIRQLLEPMEKSLTASFGGGSTSPMIGGMIMTSLSESISNGGGLGFASVIEEALRGALPQAARETLRGALPQAARETLRGALPQAAREALRGALPQAARETLRGALPQAAGASPAPVSAGGDLPTQPPNAALEEANAALECG